MASTAFIQATKALYQLARPFIFRNDAQTAHERLLRLLSRLDNNPLAVLLLKSANRLAFDNYYISAGGVWLPHPFILAAGMVKGHGFDDEKTALAAIRKGVNIIPGWRSLPALVGPVEFGSFTRYPRMGNSGTVMWRDTATRSTQNRVGLKNPGAVAAAAFLSLRRDDLPATFGVNIAVSPGIDGIEEEQRHVSESISAFVARGVYPSWFTLNLSCPNTEDDPGDHQTEQKTRALCETALTALADAERQTGRDFPLWVKISPTLATSQYGTLMQVFAEIGVSAVVATNTLPLPAPDQRDAGTGGGRLHPHAVNAVQTLMAHQHADVDIIGCGGVADPATYNAFAEHGVKVVQYWSGLIYRGPLLAALILDEIRTQQ